MVAKYMDERSKRAIKAEKAQKHTQVKKSFQSGRFSSADSTQKNAGKIT
jgi:hypothetical protein